MIGFIILLGFILAIPSMDVAVAKPAHFAYIMQQMSPRTHQHQFEAPTPSTMVM